MDRGDKNSDCPPLVARKIGARHFQRWDNADSGSLGSRYFGKVLIDCKFRFAESQWGTLGPSNAPAGVIYIDLSFNQPKTHRLASASIQISLHDFEMAPASAKGKRKGQTNAVASGLAVTDKFGPQMLTGKPTISFGKTSYSLKPEVGAMGAHIGGVGVSGEKMVVYSSQWVLDGHLVPGNPDGVVPRGATYKTLKWDLSEDDFTSQSPVHGSVVHTGFAITHEAKPFYIKVKIEGKLRKLSDRLKSKFVFPPRSRKDQGTALTLLQLSSKHRNGLPLDSLARGLKDAMLQRNLHAVPWEMPGARRAANSGEITTPGLTEVSGKMEDPTAPPSYTQAQKPADIEKLSAATSTFGAMSNEDSSEEVATTFLVAELSKDIPKAVPKFKDTSKEGTEPAEDKVQRLSAYSIVVTLLHVLTRLLDLVGGVKDGMKDA